MPLDWSDDYLIGIHKIDNQHKEFFRIAHRFYGECSRNEGEHIIGETLRFLKNYAIEHFTDEEIFMLEHEYPRVEEHRKLHAAFLDEYSKLIEEFSKEGMTRRLADHVLKMVQEWLIDHIARADVDYARHAKQRI